MSDSETKKFQKWCHGTDVHMPFYPEMVVEKIRSLCDGAIVALEITGNSDGISRVTRLKETNFGNHKNGYTGIRILILEWYDAMNHDLEQMLPDTDRHTRMSEAIAFGLLRWHLTRAC